MKFVNSLAFGLVLVSTLQAQDENQSTSDYTVAADLQYCTGAGKALLMDVFVPRKRIPDTPACVMAPRRRLGARRQERELGCPVSGIRRICYSLNLLPFEW
jgi:hypothetical protein